MVPTAFGHFPGRRRDRPRRQQNVHGVPVFRQAVDHHAVRAMKTNLESSAPHVYPAVEWQPAAAHEHALVLHKSDRLEVGIRRWPPGNSTFTSELDTLCYFQRGRGWFRRDTGE